MVEESRDEGLIPWEDHCKEAAANLALIPEKYRVRVCESGGPEDVLASLAVSIAKLAELEIA